MSAEQTVEDTRVSVPGYTEEQVAHLSPRQRQKLADELNAGKSAGQRHAEALEYNRKLQEKSGAQPGPTATALDAETIVANRIAEQRIAEQRAAEQQALNAAANATKEAGDFNESVEGRQVLPASVSEHVADAALKLSRERVDQAEEGGIKPGSGIAGHPATSEAQAEAVLANAAKEIGDRAQEPAYAGDQTYQGHGTENVRVARTPVFDDGGALTGFMVNGVFEPDEDYEPPKVDLNPDTNQQAQEATEGQSTEPQVPGQNLPAGQNPGTEPNGQVQNPGEPNADQVALGLGQDDDHARSRRGRKAQQKPAAGKAVGDGPKSE